ncbi:MAG: amidohydrolase, partial [Phycisphaerales bacterium]|nr:amidohydrolase [Phycisphaerales bacterium]
GVKHVAGLAGGTGVLAYIPPTVHGAEARGSIALRADMDALPITEATGLPYASTTPGLMHACGHDGHTANLLGVARVLMQLAHRPSPVTLVFQPAEEGGAGGKRMCEDGALDGSKIGPKVRAIFGLHGWPQYGVGLVGSRPGPMLASTDNFHITITGTQSHAAYPQLSADPVVATAHIIAALQTVASRNIAPQDSIVVSVTMLKAGTATNIIPERATFGGTMRTLKAETRQLGRRRVCQIIEQTAAAMGCTATIDWQEGYPVTFNDPGATDTFFRVARQALGDTRVLDVPHPSLGGEDFSYYGHHVPACFFMLGVKPDGRESYPSLHQPTYDFNDEAMRTGIEMMVRLATDEG